MSGDENVTAGPLSECGIIDLPKFTDERGNLCFVEKNEHVPFDIKRVYYLYDVPGDQIRGEHAHPELEQVMIAVNGSFAVLLDDGFDRKIFYLDNPSEGLYIAPLMWRSVSNFSEGAVALSLAATYYDEDDYVRDYEEFLRVSGAQ